MAFLPPNTTSHLQPLDAGIIASFKNRYKQNYCRHMLKLFEEGKDINQEKINVKEAIDYLADAWKNVTEETILNCWKKTGILPSSTNGEVEDAMQTQQGILNEETANINQIIGELDTESDIHAAALANAINDFFCDLEEDIPTEEILNDDDIIKLVQEEACSDESDDDSEEEPLMISLGDAFKSLKTWIEFFEQQFIDDFDVKDMDVFKKYFAIVQRLESQARKQSSITEFFSIHNN